MARMDERPDLAANIDASLPYSLALQVWGRRQGAHMRLLQHCQDAFAALGPVELAEEGGHHCMSPTYRLLVNHVLEPSPAGVEATMLRGLQTLRRMIGRDRAAEQLPPVRMTTMDTWNPRNAVVDQF